MNALALKAVPEDGRSRIALAMGEALCRIANTYPTIPEVILEQVQNAIDANARKISVTLNQKDRNIAIRDDGDGVTRATLDEALQLVCAPHRKEKGKLGRFSIGLISALGKCERFVFTSCHRSVTTDYHEWTFVTDDIRRQSDRVDVPHRTRENLCFKPKGGPAKQGLSPVNWRTEVKIESYSTDRMISRIDSIESLRDAILEKFSTAMRKRDVRLFLKFKNVDGTEKRLEDIRAAQFTGKPLPVITIDNEDSGRVTFRLYLAQKTSKGLKGTVVVGESDDDYRFDFKLFADCQLMSDEVVKGLRSGIFEGEIVAEKVALHASRRSFEKNDALVGMCEAVEAWFTLHGARHLEEVKDTTRDERWQTLGLESLREIEALLLLDKFKELHNVLGSFKKGNVIADHVTGTKVIMPEPAIPTNHTDPGREPANDHDGEGSSTPSQPEDSPFTVAGPRGKPRAVVKHNNLGLQFSYVPMDGSDRLWELDVEEGVLRFNVNHEIWVACDVSDRKVRQLQEMVTINALTTYSMPQEWQEVTRMSLDEALRPLVHLLHASPAFYVGGKRPTALTK